VRLVRTYCILNLSSFNEHIYIYAKYSFQNGNFTYAINLVTKTCFFGSVDLSDAYYSISIVEPDRKYFSIFFKGEKYQFGVLVRRLTTAPRVFTKILKPIFATLRKKGLLSTVYIDDSCLLGASFGKWEENIWSTMKLLDNLGLTIHPTKSVLVPTQ